MHIAINFLLFQAGWFAAVVGAANHMEWLAVFSVMVIIAIHLLLVKHSLPELKFIIATGATGFVVDSTLIAQDVFSPVNQSALMGPMPAWLIALWMLFAITVNHSLGWLGRNLILQPIAGLLFAPMAYYAGFELDALTFTEGSRFYFNLLIIGICWMVVVPLLFRLSTAINLRDVKATRSQSFLY